MKKIIPMVFFYSTLNALFTYKKYHKTISKNYITNNILCAFQQLLFNWINTFIFRYLVSFLNK